MSFWSNEKRAPDETPEASAGPSNDEQRLENYNTGIDPGLHSVEQELDDDEELPPYAPPDYMNVQREGVQASTRINDEGRVNINIDQKFNRLSTLFGPALNSQLQLARAATSATAPPDYFEQDPTPEDLRDIPRLNLLIQVVGSRGDVQPFIALGKVLKERHGHRVRLATHPVFKKFVEENGLEFFSLSGDPSELMAFMVKNPGLVPGFEAIKSGDVGKRRKGIYQILLAGWRSAVEPGDGMGDGPDGHAPSFIADAIIANPPAFSHIHVAEALNIPLHMMFTMPWSPTQSFPHPLANIQSANTESNVTNFMSYLLIELFTWQGLGSLINRFREKTLGLEPVSSVWGPVMIAKQRVPYTYCWSPAIIPKPADWGPHIKLAGFFFLQQASSYTPPQDLADFLNAGPPPVYIGFGSIVVDDPNALTKTIFDAIRMAGCRAVVSRGWGGMGDGIDVPEGTYMIGNCPHDWLFARMSAVVHHGGAGTTAAGISLGKPTVVVPFFGDQPFWGSMVARAGAGPDPIPHKQLTAEKLADAIKIALKPETLSRAQELSERIGQENGTQTGADSFHGSLPLKAMRCSVTHRRAACFRFRKTSILLSPLAAITLVSQNQLKWEDLKRIKSKSWLTDVGSVDPVSGATTAIMGSIFGSLAGFGDLPKEVYKYSKNKVGEDRTIEDTSVGKGKGKAKSKHSDSVTSLPSPGPSPLLSPVPSQQSIPRKPVRGSRSRSTTSHDSEANLEHQDSNPSTKSEQSATRSNMMRGAMGPITPLLRAPVDFSYNVAQGFRNAPLMYGDDTVRPQKKITNLQSGLAVAGKEFGFGFYDGVAGIFTQPVKGAIKEGPLGFVKGFGKGIGGAFLKPGAAIWGIPGYAFKGMWREIENLSRTNTKEALRSARIAQGMQELETISNEEAEEISQRFREALDEETRNNKSWYQRLGKTKSQQNIHQTQHLPSVPTSYFASNSSSSLSTAHGHSFSSSTPSLAPRSSTSSASYGEPFSPSADPDPIYPSFSNHRTHPAHASTFPQPQPHTRTPSFPSQPHSQHHSSFPSQSQPQHHSSFPAFPTIPSPQTTGIVELSATPSVRELAGHTPSAHDAAALLGAGRPQTLRDHGTDGLPAVDLASPSDEVLARQRGIDQTRGLEAGLEAGSGAGLDRANSRHSVAVRTSVYEPASSSDDDEEGDGERGSSGEGRRLPIPVDAEQAGQGPVSPMFAGVEWRRGGESGRPRADTARTGDVAFDPVVGGREGVERGGDGDGVEGEEGLEEGGLPEYARSDPLAGSQSQSQSQVSSHPQAQAQAQAHPQAQPTEDPDDQLRQALAASTSQQPEPSASHPPHAHGGADADEEQLRLALAASMAEFQSQAARDSRADMEDAAVLEYVKKASLAEEEYMRRLRGE